MTNTSEGPSQQLPCRIFAGFVLEVNMQKVVSYQLTRYIASLAVANESDSDSKLY